MPSLSVGVKKVAVHWSLIACLRSGASNSSSSFSWLQNSLLTNWLPKYDKHIQAVFISLKLENLNTMMLQQLDKWCEQDDQYMNILSNVAGTKNLYSSVVEGQLNDISDKLCWYYFSTLFPCFLVLQRCRWSSTCFCSSLLSGCGQDSIWATGTCGCWSSTSSLTASWWANLLISLLLFVCLHMCSEFICYLIHVYSTFCRDMKWVYSNKIKPDFHF